MRYSLFMIVYVRLSERRTAPRLPKESCLLLPYLALPLFFQVIVELLLVLTPRLSHQQRPRFQHARYLLAQLHLLVHLVLAVSVRVVGESRS
jgi:hypothetical protein